MKGRDVQFALQCCKPVCIYVISLVSGVYPMVGFDGREAARGTYDCKTEEPDPWCGGRPQSTESLANG